MALFPLSDLLKIVNTDIKAWYVVTNSTIEINEITYGLENGNVLRNTAANQPSAADAHAVIPFCYYYSIDTGAVEVTDGSNWWMVKENKVVANDKIYYPYPGEEVDTQIIFVKESVAYGGRVYTLVIEGIYIYVAGASTGKVQRRLKTDLSLVDQSAAYGTIRKVLLDDTYVYACYLSGSDYKVVKLLKTDLSFVAVSANYGGTIRGMVADDDYIYIGGDTTQTVWKLNKSDLSRTESSPGVYVESATHSNIQSLCIDGTNLYVGGQSGNKIWKLSTTDLSKTDESGTFGSIIYNITTAGDYVYVCASSKKTYKLDKATLSVQAESAVYGGYPYALYAYGDYLYVVDATGAITKLEEDTLTVIVENTDNTTALYSVVADGPYVYVGLDSPEYNIRKYFTKAYRNIYWQAVD
jgi:hypothetical protein